MRTLPLSCAPLAVSSMLSLGKRITLYGPGASTLSYRFAAETACNEKQVVFICGDNRFDPYAIARMAKQLHHSREAALSRILVARAFTGYQLDELLRRLKPNEVTGPVILSGLCSVFMDEDIPIEAWRSAIKWMLVSCFGYMGYLSTGGMSKPTSERALSSFACK